MSKVLAVNKKPIDEFLGQLNCYKELIDGRIGQYLPALESQISENFGEYPLEAFKPFSSYMLRGGKRIRGALTILGYEMFGGKDIDMITDAAMAIEMLQSYLLIMDDIQDKSETRRGGPTAHVMMRDYHRSNHLNGDSKHFGESIAMDSYLVGCHAAFEIIASLNVEPSILLKAMRNIHSSYMTTAHGQTLDIFSEVTDVISEEYANNVLLWKTAYYTFVNPLQFGAILAGANGNDLKMILDYAVPAGKAFQITDDILGIYGNEFDSGKSPMDDINDGKKTILVIKALELASQPESYFLRQCLGKGSLTAGEFKECQKIISQSGALEYAKSLAKTAVDDAKEALLKGGSNCSQRHLIFLGGLLDYLLERKA
jgi:geranylgeranyl diphosphate synthase type I